MSGTRGVSRARFLGAVAAVVLVLVVVPLTGVAQEGEVVIQSSAGGIPVPVQTDAVTPTTTTTAVPAPTTSRGPVVSPTTVRPRMTTTTSISVSISASTTTVPAAVAAVVPGTSTTVTVAAPTTAAPTTAAPTTTTTTVAACRNSTDPVCGAFRFHTQPAADHPMTVSVATEPASPVAGQEMVFRITLTDPDGASYGSSLYFLGDSGLGETRLEECRKFGPWDPPTPDPGHAVVVITVRHTYAQAGSYPTNFAFDAGPFDCTDAGTGRGDRPYASSASATHTVVVGR